MTATEPCPSCRRPNANWRVTCLYCGTRMPNPAPPPPPKPVPDNLDALVRDAMRGGDLGALRRALEAPAPTIPPVGPPAATPAASTPGAPSAAPASPRPTAPPALPVGLPVAGPLSLPGALDALVAAAGEARARAADPSALAGALARVAARLEDVRRAAPEPTPEPTPDAPAAPPEPPSPVVLPPIRHAFALVVDGAAESDAAEIFGAAFEVDPATARAIAAVRHIQVALRSADAAALQRRADALAVRSSLRATVVARADLLTIPAALAVLAREPAGAWRVVDRPLWEDEPDPANRPEGDLLDDGSILLALPGEVGVRAGRDAPPSSRWLRQAYTAEPQAPERRVALVDLHTRARILRVTASVTDFQGFPERDPASTVRSLKLFVDHLAERFPGVRVEARRVCVPTNASGDARYTTGWPQWEEYTRAARRHVLGASAD